MRSATPGAVLGMEDDQLVKEWGGGEPNTKFGSSDCTGKSEMGIGFSRDKPDEVR